MAYFDPIHSLSDELEQVTFVHNCRVNHVPLSVKNFLQSHLTIIREYP